MKALQHLLVTSFEAKVLAVRKVTSNKGKRTAGVDHIKWDTDAKKDKGCEFFETERLQGSPLEKGQHTQKQWKDETARNTDHEG